MTSIVPIDHQVRQFAELISTDLFGLYNSPKSLAWKKKIVKYVRSLPKWDELKSLIFDLGRMALSFIEFSRKVNERLGYEVTMKIPRELNGNSVIWIILKEILTRPKRYLTSGELKKGRSMIHQAINSESSRRQRGLGTEMASSKTLSEEAELEYCASLYKLSEVLKYEYGEALKDFSQLINSEYKNRADRSTRLISIRIVSGVVFLKLRTRTYPLSVVHFKRLCDCLLAYGNLAIGLGELPMRCSASEFICDFISLAKDCSNYEPNKVGEYIKASRNLMVSQLASDNAMGVSAYESLLSTMDPDKRCDAKSFVSFFKSATSCLEDAINVACLFKYVPHPDCDMPALFDSIKGLKDPNRIAPNFESRFAGICRRSLFKSMKAGKHYVNVERKEEGDDILGGPLADMVNATQCPISRAASKSALQWDSVRFQKVTSLPKFHDIKLSPSDKASQAGPLLRKGDFEEMRKWSMAKGGLEKSEKHLSVRSVNDAVSAIKGTCQFDSKTAVKRFEKVIKLHEAFESRYPGLEPEDIPEKDFEDFILSNEEARYLIGTEPKLGELHKKVTRLFYMAEQELKILTQRVERLGRQMSRSQTGVSIVKSYTARRKDLEHFCEAMTGDYDENRAVFVSFDMSEFSKKFPMTLVRKYGEIMAEITGETWMRRIDLFFRSGVIIHNTRGYFNYIAGVSGGFEGFLNFIWSSIHAVIMEISLESTGLSGTLLTFSDDGLLMFYFPYKLGHGELIKKVMAIQKTYKSLGLIFHLGKTIVSSIVWEYLGDICYRNKLLPTWVKDLAKVGIVEEGEGLGTVYDHITAICGQARSLAATGFSSQSAYIIMHIHISRKFYWLAPNISDALRELLYVIPTSCSGFRIPSSLELQSSTTVESTSEFLADLILLGRIFPDEVESVCGFISSNAYDSKRAVQMICNGQRIGCYGPDTSGALCSHKIIDQVISKYPDTVKLVTEPLSKPVEKKIGKLLERVTCLDPTVIAKFMANTPGYIEYSKSMQLVKGNGSVRITSRTYRKKIQAKDTHDCRAAVRMWEKAILSKCGTGCTPFKMMSSVNRVTFRKFDLKPLKPSPRMIIREVACGGNITVNFSLRHTKSLISESYREPQVVFPQDDTSLKWFSESAGSSEGKSTRQFMAVAASAIANDPEAADLYYAICNVLQIHLPFIPSGRLASIRRLVAQGGHAQDVRVCYNSAIWALSEASYNTSLARDIFQRTRGDRMTYLTMARLMAHNKMLFQCNNKRGDKTPSNIIQYSLDESYLSSAIGDFRMSFDDSDWDDKLTYLDEKSQGLIEEFNTSLLEYTELKKASQNYVNLSSGEEEMQAIDTKICHAVSIEALSRWIVESLMHTGRSLLPYSSIPNYFYHKVYVFKRAVVKSAWNMMHPDKKSQLTSYLLRNFKDDKFYNNNVPLEQYDLEIEEEFIRIYFEKLCDIVDSFSSLGGSLIPNDSLHELTVNTHDTLLILYQVVSAVTFCPVFRGSTTIIRGSASQSGKMSASHRVAYRQAFSNTISAIMSAASDHSWNDEQTLESLGFNPRLSGGVDLLLDWLFLTRDLIRESSHRTTHNPYNKTSALITALKMYSILEEIGSSRSLSEDNDFLRAMILNYHVKPRMASMIRSTILRTIPINIVTNEKRLGADHERMITTQLPVTLIPRMIHHINQMRRGQPILQYKKYLRNPIRLMNDQTAFYNTVIAGASKNIVDVSSSQANMMSQLLIPSYRTEASTFSIDVNEKYIGGDDIPVGTHGYHEDLVNLLSAHVDEALKRSGFASVMPLRTLELSIRDNLTLMGLSSRDGIPLGDYKNSADTGMNVVAKQFRSEEEAINTYINLSRDLHSSLSLIKLRGSGNYEVGQLVYLVGVTAKSYQRTDSRTQGESGEDPFIILPNDVSTSDLIAVCTVKSEAVNVAARTRALFSSNRSTRDSQFAGAFISQYMKHASHSGFVNHESNCLQAAVIAASEVDSTAMQIWGYNLFRSYVTNRLSMRETVDRYKRNVSLINRVSPSGPTMERTDLIDDIQKVCYFLRSSNIKAGSEVDMKKVGAILRNIPRYRSNYVISALVQARSIISMQDLCHHMELREEERLWTYLYTEVHTQQFMLEGEQASLIDDLEGDNVWLGTEYGEGDPDYDLK